MPEPAHRLVIRRELRLIRKVELRGPVMTVGRSPQCDISLDHPSVSRNHLRLEERDGQWFIIDNRSTNGVLLNGRRVTEVELRPGDIIELRPFSISYQSGTTDIADQSIRLVGSAVLASAPRHAAPGAAVVKQRLDELYAMARAVIRRRDDGLFWHSVQSAICRSLAADRCVVIGLDDSIGRAGVAETSGGAAQWYRLAPHATSPGLDQPLEVSGSVLRDVIDSHRGVLIQNVASHEQFAQAVSLVGGGVGSVICVPVDLSNHTRAIVYADRRGGKPPFGNEDLDFVTAAVDLATAAVELDELQETARELARVNGRIDAARDIQKLLLPSPLPQPPWGQVAALNLPADYMSGDVFEVAIDPAGRLVTMVADVSGKGVPAAFLTVILQSTLRLCLSTTEDLTEIVNRVNAAIQAQSSGGAFATMILCRWSPDGAAVEIANAGHFPAFWLKKDGSIDSFPNRVGLPLGIASPWDGQIVTYDAREMTASVLFSDGVIEARNAAQQEYGLQRFHDSFAKVANASSEEVVHTLADGVRTFCYPREPEDDVTLLAVSRGPAA